MKKILLFFMTAPVWAAALQAQSPSVPAPGESTAQSPSVSAPREYPAYSDRRAWAAVKIADLDNILKTADEALGREWTPVMFSDWKKYTQTGDESCMKARSGNAVCLEAMIVAELTRGDGRYLMQIADYAWLQSTCPYWNEKDVALEKAVVHYFKSQLDAMDPSICETILRAVGKNSPEQTERPEQTEQTEQTERPVRPNQTERPNQIERPEQTDRTDRP